MVKMTKDEFKENNPHINDVNAAWRKDELLPGTISGVVPDYPLEKQLAALQQATRTPAPVARQGALKAFSIFGGKKSESSPVSPSKTPTPKKP